MDSAIWTALHRIACVIDNVLNVRFDFDAPPNQGGQDDFAPQHPDEILHWYRQIRARERRERPMRICNEFKNRFEKYWGNVSPWLRGDIGYYKLTYIDIDQSDEGTDVYWEFDNDETKGYYFILKKNDKDGLPFRYQIYLASVLDVEGIADWSNVLFGSKYIEVLLFQYFTKYLHVPVEILLDDYSDAQWFRDDLPEDVLDINIMFSQLLSAQVLKDPPPTYKMRTLSVEDQRVIWEHTVMQSFMLYYITKSNYPDQYATPLIYFQNTVWVLDYDRKFITHVGGDFCRGGVRGTPGNFILNTLEQRTEVVRKMEGYGDIKAILDIPLPIYDEIYALTLAIYLKEDGQLGFERSQVRIKTTPGAL